jgi:hypothetical protein
MNSFAKYLPSKGFLAVSAAVLFSFGLVGGVFALTRSDVAENKPIIPILASASESAIAIQNELSNKDSDNDGLKDWEENLWGSSPNNSDTDGDGVNDGDEISNKRNPTIKGPNDSLISTDKNSSGVKEIEQPLTETDRIARITFARYMQLKNDSKPIDEAFQKQLLNEITSTTLQNSKPPRLYTESDLKIIPTNTDSMKVYGNKMGELIKSATWGVDELSVIKSALDKEDEKALSKLDIPISGYRTILEKSIATEVPNDAVREHLLLVNALSKMIDSLEGAKLSFKDPALALSFFGKYPEYVTALHRAFIDIQGLFTRNNITYDRKEPGFIYAKFDDIVQSAAQRN